MTLLGLRNWRQLRESRGSGRAFGGKGSRDPTFRWAIRDLAGFQSDGHVGVRAVGKITRRFTVADTEGDDSGVSSRIVGNSVI
jgi:hypothetical protein